MSKSKKPSKKHTKVSKGKVGLTALKRGDLIDIVAPGSATEPTVVADSVTALEALGFKVRVSEKLLNPQLFLSNTDEFRFKDLKKALLAKDSKAIWCLRGGYGAIRLLPLLNKLKKPKFPKLLIGISDMSSLHLFLNQNWKWPSLHAPLVDRFALKLLSEENIREVMSAIQGELTESRFDKLEPLTPLSAKVKKITGPVIGGNLMVITSSLGTANQIQTEGRILFLEEMSERGYRIDRCLRQMHQAGALKGVKAIVLGDFIKCEEPNGTDLSTDTIARFCSDVKIPVFKGIESGHAPLQRPVFFNTNAVISKSVIAPDRFQMLIYSPYEVFKPRK